MKQIDLLEKLQATDAKSLTFTAGKSYYWSPKDKTVFYQETDKSPVGLWTLLHETCHGLLDHTSYQSDFELVMLEVDAWEKALELAVQLNNESGIMNKEAEKNSSGLIYIDQDHVQDCLDSYRDWQYKRSLCPRCELGGIQIDPRTYSCMFCNDTWKVSAARFCRPYRMKS